MRSCDCCGAPFAAKLEMNRVADQGQMREGLREIAEKGVTRHVYLLAQESDIVGLCDQPLEQGARFAFLAERQICVDQPEAADQKGALLAGNTVFRTIAPDVIALPQLLLDGGDGSLQRVTVYRKAEHRREQERRIGM